MVSVNWTLKNELDAVVFPGQLRCAKRAGSVKCVSTMRQRDLRPVFCRLLRAHVSARSESMSGRTSIHVKACFATQPQRHVGANGSAHRALPLVGFCVTAMSPVVIAMNVTAAEVRPRLLLFHHIFAVDAGECQRV